MQWSSSPCPCKFKVQTSDGKIMCTVSGMLIAEGILLIDYMPHKVKVTGVYYADLFHKLRVAVKEKCGGQLTQILLPLHDSALHLLTGRVLDKPLYLNVD